MKERMKKISMGQRGASALEFAIVLPLLLLILFGIMEFGLLLYNKQVITNASREGARAGIVSQTPRLACTGDPSITNVVNDYCLNHLVTFNATPAPPVISCEDDYDLNASFSDDLRVTVKYSYDFLLLPDFIKSLTFFFGESTLSNNLNLNASSVMKYE